MLVHGSVHVPPHPGHLDVGLIDEPSVADTVTARPCRLDDQRGEALYPPVDGDVIDVDAAFGEKFFDVAVGQPVAEVPAHRQQDHVRWEPETSKRGRLKTATTKHPGTLRAAPDPSTQRCPCDRTEVDPVRRTGWLCGDAVAATVEHSFVVDG